MSQNQLKYKQKHTRTFTGKERDSETGFSYFGARYYDSDLMTGWLSVDPMADKYPNISPYAYCGWNPIKFVDPNGLEKIKSLSNSDKDKKISNAADRYYNNAPVIHLWAHGNKKSIDYYDDNGNRKEINSASEMSNFLIANSSVYRDNNIVNGKTSILVLHSCETGMGDENIAKDISANLNLLVVAPSDLVKVLTTDPNTPNEYSFEYGVASKAPTIYDGNKLNEENIGKGVWNIYYKGIKVDSFDGATKPVFKNPEEIIRKYEQKYQQILQNENQ